LQLFIIDGHLKMRLLGGFFELFYHASALDLLRFTKI